MHPLRFRYYEREIKHSSPATPIHTHCSYNYRKLPEPSSEREGPKAARNNHCRGPSGLMLRGKGESRGFQNLQGPRCILWCKEGPFSVLFLPLWHISVHRCCNLNKMVLSAAPKPDDTGSSTVQGGPMKFHESH